MYFLYKAGGWPFQEPLWALVRQGVLSLHDLTFSDRLRMETLMLQYRDAPMDLADASLVVTAESLNIQRIFTLDRHFYAYRLWDKEAFQIMP
jgi:predicted nucleic acid-binding protein